MATNPRIPPNRPNPSEAKGPQLASPGPLKTKRPGTGVPGVLFAIVVAAALIAAIVYYMPRAPKKLPTPSAAQVPAQPVANQLQFTNVQMSLGPTGQAMDLQGQVINNGRRPLLGATVQLTFLGQNGNVLTRISHPLMGMDNMDKKGVDLVPDEFGTHPLPANQARWFRIQVSPVPTGWNHQTPGMVVLNVSTEGNH